MRKSAIGVMALVLGALALVGCSHEAADWKAATSANSSEAYQQFLKQYPRSANAAQAQARVTQLAEDRDWQADAAADTRIAYEQFVTTHPESKWTQEARIRIENFAQAASNAPAVADASTATSPTAVAPATAAPKTARATSRAHKAPRVASVTPSHHAPARAAKPSHERVVQLGAYRSKSRAESQWKLLQARYPTQLKSAHPRYVAVHGRTGELYRLQVELSSANDAKGLCTTLKHHAQSCVRVSA